MLFLDAQRRGIIRGIRASQNGLRINHPFFANDALLFFRNKINEAKAVSDILRTFDASGQKINLSKPMLYFSPNTSKDQRTTLGNFLGMRIVETMVNYLGLPLIIGKNKIVALSISLIGLLIVLKGGPIGFYRLGGKKFS